jgi:hypothetical protein
MFQLEKSEYLDSIYYADLFKICGKVWMIMGSGKSGAGRIASNLEKDSDLARDGVALIAKNNQLFGRFDLGASGVHADQDSPLDELHQIDFIAFCLDVQQTAALYNDAPQVLRSTTAEIMARLSVFNMYPASMARNLCTPDEFAYYASPALREEKFKELVLSTGFASFLLVPFMATVQEKANLYVERSQLA